MTDASLYEPRLAQREPEADALLREVSDAPRLDAGDQIDAGDRRTYRIYDAHAALELTDELQFLMRRAVEPNVFFDPRFLLPAMGRLDEREVRLLVARDEGGRRSRLRFFLPFTVERLPRPGRSVLRAWSHPFGPIGTLPLDGDDPVRSARDLLAALREERGLPRILALPDLRLEGRLVETLREAARLEGLLVSVCDERTRAALTPSSGVSGRERRERARLLRRLEAHGPVRFEEAREPDAVREATEEFLALEASGWKGRQRTALVQDRFRAAFAREAVNGLASVGGARVFTLWVGEEPAASLVVLAANGEAAAWKTAYDERFRDCAPGALVLSLATERLLADPAIRFADSCAVPDHKVMNRLWRARTRVGTLVIALEPGLEREVERAAVGLNASRRRQYRRHRWMRALRRWTGLV